MLTATQRIRVEWGECDPAGIIFNPNYYLWMDSGTHALIAAAGFDLFANIYRDPLFRGCPLVASNMAFRRPLYLGDIAVCASRVDKFGNTSFTVAHEFFRGDEPEAVARGSEVRVWGYADADEPTKLIATRMPDELRAALSEDRSVDVTV